MLRTRICEKSGYKRNIKERLDALVEIHSVKTKLLGTSTCLSLPKLNQDSNSKESSNETLSSKSTLSISEDEELIKYKSSIIDEFDALKLSFFAEVNSFVVFSEYPFFLKLKNTVSFCIKLLKDHIWIYISNFMIFFPYGITKI